MATRRERVVLELQDDFSRGMAEAAAATALLNRELHGLSGSAVQSDKATRDINREIDNTGKSSSKSAKEVDKLSGRLRILADVAVLLGPTLAPIGTVGVAGIAALSSELGFAAIGAGTAILAFQGIGDTLKALNKASLEPTAENVEALRVAMGGLTPAARGFVGEIRSLMPELEHIRDIAQENLFAGLTDGLKGLEGALPAVEKLVGGVAAELGKIAGDAGSSLGSERWAPFLEFLGREAPLALGDMAKAAGNVAHAFAELWMATSPLNQDFSAFLVRSTGELDRWAEGLSKTQGFQDFIAYVRTEGPRLAETIGALANAFLQVVEAAAPLAGPVLASLTAVANIVAAISDSNLGTPIYTAVAAFVALNRVLQLSDGGVAKVKAQFSNLSTSAKFGATVLGIEAVSGALDHLFHQNLEGSDLQRSLDALANGSITGELEKTFGSNLKGFTAQLGLANAHDPASNVGRTLGHIPVIGHIADTNPFNYLPGGADGNPGIAHSTDNIKKLDQALAGLVEGGKADEAQAIIKQLAAAGASSGDIKKGFEQYGIALKNAGRESAAFSLETAKQNEAVRAAKTAARATGNAFLAFGSSLSDSKVSLSDWVKELNQQADALSNFAANAKRAADKGLRQGLIKALQDAGPQGALRLKQLANASDAEIGRANRAWGRGRRAIRDYIAQAGAVKPVKLKVDDSDKSKVSGLEQLLRGFSGKTYTANAKVLVSGTDALDHFVEHPKKPQSKTPAAGGWILGAGTATSDSIPAYLSNGEYVIKAAAVQRYGVHMFDGLNAMRFAGGGSVDNTPDSVLGNLYGSGSGSSSGSSSTARAAAHHVANARLRRELDRMTKALAGSTAAIEKEKSQRDDLVSKRSDLASSVGDKFRTDIFGETPSNFQYFSAADKAKYLTGNPLSILQSDTANAGKFQGLLATLSRNGLNGQAFAALAQTGDVGRAQAFAGLSRGDIARFESAYNRREAAAGSVGNYAGAATYNPQINETNRQLAHLNAEHKKLTAEVNSLKHQVKSSAAGHAKSVNDGRRGHNAHRAQQIGNP